MEYQMSQIRMFLRNVQLINGDRVAICISEGLIQAVGEFDESHYSSNISIDGNGYLALPGFIDTHVHFREPGMEHKATWQTECVAALKGGVTTVIDKPNNNPAMTTYERLLQKIKLIGKVPIDYRLSFGATKTNFEEILKALKHERSSDVKVFMGSSTGDLLVDDDESIRKVFQICAENNILVTIHAEDEELMAKNRAGLGHEAIIQDHCAIRDTAVEVRAVYRALKLQEETGVRLYFCHITTPEAVGLISVAKLKGRPVYVEVCPHHLYFTDEEIEGNGNPFFKMNPPLRSQAQVQELQDLVVRTDFVDVISSDHAPHTSEEKLAKEYDKIPSGVTGVQTLGLAALHLVETHGMTLQRLADLTSGNAAKIFNLPKKGKLEAGFDADIVLIDLKTKTFFTPAMVASKCGHSPFQGVSLQGAIKLTIAKGIPYVP